MAKHSRSLKSGINNNSLQKKWTLNDVIMNEIVVLKINNEDSTSIRHT